VGAAIITDGQLFRGPYNSAGEIGHVTLDRNGEVCSCGSHGCVETFVAGPWLARRYGWALERAGLSAQDGSPITGEQVVQRAGTGDPLAAQVMAVAGDALGTAIATLAMILNIDTFVIGGSVAKAGEVLLEPARRALPNHAYRSVGCGVKVLATELGDDGPILGCAWLARGALANAATRQTNALPDCLYASEREHLETVEGIVFDIQRFSVHDGPGIRTNVFLKGCAMRCAWCANPESQSLHPELMLSAGQCINCGQFAEPCTAHWGEGGWTQTAQQAYSGRVAACPTCAVRWAGGRYTAKAVIEEVLRDAAFYDGTGGLTLTGGEPTFQPHFAEAILRLAKMHDLSTAIETSGHTRWKILERLLPYLDHILFDVKHLDAEVHKAFTGVDNLLILVNLRRLAALDAPVTIRVPLIPGFNATASDLGAIADFVAGLDGHITKTISLLPYHTLGRAKYKALGRDYPWEQHDRLTDEQVSSLAHVIEARGLTVSIGV
jgi:pyruvate formate lyase activating enzyme